MTWGISPKKVYEWWQLSQSGMSWFLENIANMWRPIMVCSVLGRHGRPDIPKELQGAPGVPQGVQVLADQHPALNSWFGASSFGILMAEWCAIVEDPMVFNFDVYLPSGKHVHVVVQGSNVEDLIAAVERSFGGVSIRLLALPPKSPRVVCVGFLKESGEVFSSGYSEIRPQIVRIRYHWLNLMMCFLQLFCIFFCQFLAGSPQDLWHCRASFWFRRNLFERQGSPMATASWL